MLPKFSAAGNFFQIHTVMEKRLATRQLYKRKKKTKEQWPAFRGERGELPVPKFNIAIRILDNVHSNVTNVPM